MLYNMKSFVESIFVKVLTLCPETLVAVGGGAKSPLLVRFKPVLRIEQNCEVSL